MGTQRKGSMVDKREYGSEEWAIERERKASLDLERARMRDIVSLDSGREMDRSDGERVAWEDHLYDPELETEGELEISGLTSFIADEEADEATERKSLSPEEKAAGQGMSSFFKLGGLSAMSHRDTVFLSPWEQFRKYRRFPLLFFLHAIIMILCISQVMIVISVFSVNNFEAQKAFQQAFIDDAYVSSGIYTINDVTDSLVSAVNAYYALPNASSARVAFFEDENGIIPVKMRVGRFTNLEGRFWNVLEQPPFVKEDFDGNYRLIEETYDVNQTDPLGPFQPYVEDGFPRENDAFFYVQSISLDFFYHSADVSLFGVAPVDWKIELTYKMTGGETKATLHVFSNPQTTTGSLADTFYPIVIALLICSTLNLVVSIRQICVRFRILSSTRRAYQTFCYFADPGDLYPTWESIPLEAILAFFSMWNFSNLAGSLFIYASQILFIFMFSSDTQSSGQYCIVMGFAMAISMGNLARYMEYNKKFYMFVLIWRHSLGNITRYIISVSPIFFSYVFFGYMNFSQYTPLFATIDQTCISLFSLINGDDVHSTFDAVVDGRYPYPWISRVYLYTFQLLGMTSILNICIFIIEDAYHIAKHLAEQDHQTQRQHEKEKEQQRLSESQPLNIQQSRYDDKNESKEALTPQREDDEEKDESPRKSNENKENQQEREWKATGEEKLTIIFNNLEKWQIAAVGPQFAKIACRVYVTRRLINQNESRLFVNRTQSNLTSPLSHRAMSPPGSPSRFSLSSPLSSPHFSAKRKVNIPKGSSLTDSELSVSDFILIEDEKSHMEKLRDRLNEKLKKKADKESKGGEKGESGKGKVDKDVEGVIAEFYGSVEEILESQRKRMAEDREKIQQLSLKAVEKISALKREKM